MQGPGQAPDSPGHQLLCFWRHWGHGPEQSRLPWPPDPWGAESSLLSTGPPPPDPDAAGRRPRGRSPVLCLWAVVVVHRRVQPGEDGRGDVEWQVLVEEALLLGLEHEHLVVHGHLPAVCLCVHRQVLEVGHPWGERRTGGGRPLTPPRRWQLPHKAHICLGALRGPRRRGCRARVAGAETNPLESLLGARPWVLRVIWRDVICLGGGRGGS